MERSGRELWSSIREIHMRMNSICVLKDIFNASDSSVSIAREIYRNLLLVLCLIQQVQLAIWIGYIFLKYCRVDRLSVWHLISHVNEFNSIYDYPFNRLYPKYKPFLAMQT